MTWIRPDNKAASALKVQNSTMASKSANEHSRNEMNAPDGKRHKPNLDVIDLHRHLGHLKRQNETNNEVIEEIESKVESIERTVDDINSTQGTMETNLEKLYTKLSGLEEIVQGIDTQVDEILDKENNAESTLDDILSKQIDLENSLDEMKAQLQIQAKSISKLTKLVKKLVDGRE